ncbi:MAG: PqiC family protein [Magnetococcus sp. WYHC-3]
MRPVLIPMFLRLSLAGLGAAALLLGGCVTPQSPPLRYHVLSALTAAVPDTRQGLVVGLEPVVLARYLNQSGIVVRPAENEVMVAPDHRWGGELKQEIARVLARNLAVLLETADIHPLPMMHAPPMDRLVALEIPRFEPGPDGRVHLEARWRLLDGDNHVLGGTRQRVWYSDAVGLEDYAAISRAMSATLEILSRELAQDLRESLPAAPP